jgi:hypothetical protein
VNFMTRRAMRRYRRAFLGSGRRDAVAVATHLRDSLPFPDGSGSVRASGVYPSADLSPDGDPVRAAVAALGGAEFWAEDYREGGDVIHAVYVVTMPRTAHLAWTRAQLQGGPVMNDNDTSQQGGTLGTRKVRVRAFGDTADEIELFALDEARRVFGPDIPLVIDRSYAIFPVEDGRIGAPPADGKAYTASVDVRERAGS